MDSGAGLKADTWALSETNVAGYAFSAWVCVGGIQSGDSISVGIGGEATCTITNNDIPPQLHLRKVVINDNGGTATDQDFTLTANGTGTNDLSGTSPVDSGAGLKADTWALAESGPAGYTASAWVCVGGTQSGSNLTLALGESATCTITNDDQQATLKLVKTVINDNGGSAVANDFARFIDGTAVSWSVAVPVNPGAHTASETTLAGYTASVWGGDCAADGTVSVALGQSKTCTITNDDQQATLKLVKTVINDNGGSAVANDFARFIDGTAVSWSVAVPVNPGAHTASETTLAGYTASVWGGDCAADGTVSVALGQSKTCTITNDDQQATLKLVKTVINDNGGSAVANDFARFIDGTAVSWSVAVPVNPGAHTASETTLAGYTASVWGGDCAADGTVSVALGQSATCTITNDDQQATLKLVKTVINDNGGSAVANDFARFIDGTAVSWSVAVPVNPGAHTASETTLAGYTASVWGGDCAADGTVSVALGQSKTCSITNDDQQATLKLVKTVINDNGGSAVANDFARFIDGTAVSWSVAVPVNPGAHTASETTLAGYTASAWGGDCAADGTVSVALGQSKTCSITNDDQQATLKLVKTVINDNGGSAVANDFARFIDGTAVSWSVAVPVNPGAHTASETTLAGYTASVWGGDCAADGTVSVALGQSKTCTITNNDKTAHLKLVKTLTNNNGGTAEAKEWTLSAAGPTPISGAGGVASDVNAGTYALSESTGPAGYTAGSWDCVGGTQSGSSVTLALGESAICTINNNDIAPKLHLRKVVTNDNGGTASDQDFTLTANGTDANDLSGKTPVDSGDTLQADTWALSETNLAGYAASVWVCVGGTQSGSNITVGIGGEATCTITNDDIAPKLTLVKTVINDNGGTKVVIDFPLFINGVAAVSGTAYPQAANILLTATETNQAGYAASVWGGACAANGTITLLPGDDKTCSITNDDIAPKLTLVKTVINDNGGIQVASDFPLFINGCGGGERHGVSAGGQRPVDGDRDQPGRLRGLGLGRRLCGERHDYAAARG